MTQVKDLAFMAGTTWIIPFSLEDADGVAIAATGGTTTWLLQDYHTRATVITANDGAGVTYTDEAAGLGRIIITPAMQSAAGILELPGTYRHRLNFTASDSAVHDQALGEFVLMQGFESDEGDIDGESGGGGGGDSGGSSGGTSSLFFTVTAIDASRDLTDADSGLLLVYAGDTDITVTVPGTLTLGFNVTLLASGEGDIVVAEGDDAVNDSPYTTTSAQYGTISVVMYDPENPGHYVVNGGAV